MRPLRLPPFALAAVSILGVSALGTVTSKPEARLGPTAPAITCGNTRTIGMASTTGFAGQQQVRWARHFASRYNRSHRRSLRLVVDRTAGAATAARIAARLGSNARVLAVVGPSLDSEVAASSSTFRRAGLGFVSGSAAHAPLTNGSLRGFFFRVIPNNDLEGERTAFYIDDILLAHSAMVVAVAGQPMSTRLADMVAGLLQKAGLTVRRGSVAATQTNFAALIAEIVASAPDVVYLPWLLGDRAQTLGRALRNVGSQATLLGGNALFGSAFTLPDAFVMGYPVSLDGPILRSYRARHGGRNDVAGIGAYVATDVVARATARACADARASRAEVRRLIARTDIPQRQSLLGARLRFHTNDPPGPRGPGDLQAPADFAVYRVTPSGAYVRVG